VPIDFNQLREFIEAIAKTDITDLTIKEGDFELNMRKELQQSSITYTLPPAPATMMEKKENIIPVEKPTTPIVEPKSKPGNWVEITSPMVGTFYRAPAPGEPSFVEVGDRISSGQVVCIIEAMKLMNDIEAEVTGEVVEIVVENGDPVEYGQTLMWVNPN
jgi:acetyl-CoA carboxylase biotin carboxyl carrier protein